MGALAEQVRAGGEAAGAAAERARAASGRFWLAVAGIAALGAVLRLRFLDVPFTPDEGGYLYVARFWGRGADLYGDVWVDRPQGLLLLYRWAEWLGGPQVSSLRVLAIAAAAGATAALALALVTLSGRSAALIGAGLFSVLSVGPRLEGWSANGELLTAAPAAGAIALFALWLTGRTGRWSLVASGALAASALLIKQSGYDAGLAIGVWLLLAAWRGWRPRREALGALGWFALGALVPLAASFLHGLASGLGDWWFAIAGYRLSAESITTRPASERLSYLWDSLGTAWPYLVPLALFVPFGVWAAVKRPATVLLALWGGFALTAFALGGLFHPHYYVGLLPSACALAALGAVALAARWGTRLAVALAALALVPAVVDALPAYTADSAAQISQRTSDDPRLLADGPVAAYLRGHTTPDETVYALYASAAVYALADRRSPYPYIWYVGVERIPGAFDDLVALLDGPRAPRYVAVYHDPAMLDRDGRLQAVLDQRYVPAATVAGVPILRHR